MISRPSGEVRSPCRRQFWQGLLGAGCAALPSTAAVTGPLKITGFRIHTVTLRWRDLVFLEVLTDGGIAGLGEATLATAPSSMHSPLASKYAFAPATSSSVLSPERRQSDAL